MSQLLNRVRLTVALAASLAAGAGVAVALTSAQAASLASNITGGQTLASGGVIASPDSHYALTMQAGGNLVETVAGGRVLWKSGTSGAGAYAVLQGNGGLVVHAANGDVLWTNNATGTGCPSLDVQADGNVVDYDPSKAIWSTGSNFTMQNGDKLLAGQRLFSSGHTYELYLHPDGDLSLYNNANQQIWDSNTKAAADANDYLEMMPSGNVDLWSTTGARLWQTSTAGNAGAYLYIASNGNLQVESAAGKALWTSKSTGHAGTGANFTDPGPAGSSTPCPTVAPTPTTVTVPPATVTNTVTTAQTSTVYLSPPATKGTLHVRFGLDWHWSGTTTRLRGITVKSAFPRGSYFSGVYQPPHGRRHLYRASTKREVAHLLHWVQEIVYHPGDLFELTVVRRGDREEKLEFVIRDGELPACRPTCTVKR